MGSQHINDIRTSFKDINIHVENLIIIEKIKNAQPL